MTILKEYLERECEKRNINQEELAERSGLSPAHIRNVKAGKYKDPSGATYKSLAKGLDIPYKKFLEDIGEIDILVDYQITPSDSKKLLDSIEPFLIKCDIELSRLNDSQTTEIANYIMTTLKMISKKY